MDIIKRADMISMMSESLGESVRSFNYQAENKKSTYDIDRENSKGAIKRRAVEIRVQLNSLIKDVESL